MFPRIFNTLVNYMYLVIKYSYNYFYDTGTNLFKTKFYQFTKHPFHNNEIIHLSWLSSVTPCFGVPANKISIIYDPEIFYKTFIKRISEAKERITVASLYLGTGSLEKNIVDEIKNNKNFSNGALKVKILLDYLRGSRFKKNSRTMLLPLLETNNNNCDINFYHTPNLRGLKRNLSPERFREIFGLQHMKLYIFDDNLIISGANLCNDYFTNRQDRYFEIKDKNLADFYDGLVSKVQEFSFKMDRKDQLEMRKDWPHPFKGGLSDFVEKANNLIVNYILDARNRQDIEKLKTYDTWVYPLVQMQQLGIEQDSLVTENLFAEAPKEAQLYIATGYFNLTKNYIQTIVKKSIANYKILMAHPDANGFKGATGISGGIPDGFSWLLNKFYAVVRRTNQQQRISLYEYKRDNWTYHAKGLWYYPPGYDKPCLTLIGSPNFGERSVKLDLETQLAIVTENNDLRSHLHEECTYLYKSGKFADTNRYIPRWIRIMMYISQKYF